MINLKLAECDLKTGKFERFLELGTKDGFAYCGDYIFATYLDEEHPFVYDDKSRVIYASYYLHKFYKDKKDPLNRFNGLFNGMTYGEGRFVMFVNDNFSIYEQKFFYKNIDEFRYGLSINGYTNIIKPEGFPELSATFHDIYLPEKIGNLFENPELYEKIK
jgi:hypothetical protein